MSHIVPKNAFFGRALPPEENFCSFQAPKVPLKIFQPFSATHNVFPHLLTFLFFGLRKRGGRPQWPPDSVPAVVPYDSDSSKLKIALKLLENDKICVVLAKIEEFAQTLQNLSPQLFSTPGGTSFVSFEYITVC